MSISYAPDIHTRIPSDILNVICILQGTVVVSDSFSDTLLQRDDVYIVNPNFPFYFHGKNADDPCIVLSLEVDLNHYREFFPEITPDFYFTCRIDPENRVQHEYVSYLRYLLAKLYFLFQDHEYNKESQIELETNTRKLIAFLLEHFQHYIFNTDDDGNLQILLNTDLRTPYDPERIYRIIDYIYDHSSEKLRLEDLAKVEYLSTWYLSRYIKAASGLPFCDHLSMARSEKAEHLLVTTGKTIESIAQEVGFANRQHLSAQFKRWFGMSPSVYRNSYLRSLRVKKEDTPAIDYENVLPVIESYINNQQII